MYLILICWGYFSKHLPWILIWWEFMVAERSRMCLFLCLCHGRHTLASCAQHNIASFDSARQRRAVPEGKHSLRVQGSMRDWRVRPVRLSIPSLSFHGASMCFVGPGGTSAVAFPVGQAPRQGGNQRFTAVRRITNFWVDAEQAPCELPLLSLFVRTYVNRMSFDMFLQI